MNDRPLQEPTFLLLTALAEGPQHGYGIMTDVDRISDGRVKLRAGTLYAALDRLAVEVERLQHNAAAAARRLKLRHRAMGGLA